MRVQQQAKRAEERRPKMLSVDDLLLDLDAVKASEDQQDEEHQEEWGGDMGQWQESASQQWHQPGQERGEDWAAWSQQSNEFSGSRANYPQQGEWHQAPTGGRQDERRNDRPKQGASNKRYRPSKGGRRY